MNSTAKLGSVLSASNGVKGKRLGFETETDAQPSSVTVTPKVDWHHVQRRTPLILSHAPSRYLETTVSYLLSKQDEILLQEEVDDLPSAVSNKLSLLGRTRRSDRFYLDLR